MTDKKQLSSIEKLKAQQSKIKERIEQIEAREKVSNRKKETRQKILIGSYYLDKYRSDNKFNELVSLMDDYLKRKSDRVLFDLNTVESE